MFFRFPFCSTLHYKERGLFFEIIIIIVVVVVNCKKTQKEKIKKQKSFKKSF